MMGTDGKNYVVGRGELYFDQYKPGTMEGTGERYIGNTPELTTTAETEELEHYDSDHGLNEKDDSVTLSTNRSGAFTTDNISPENLALLYMGKTLQVTQTAEVGLTEEITVKRGYTYQIGTSETNPAGLRHLDNVVVNAGATPVTAAGNYEIDLDLGRIYIEVDAPDITDDTALSLTYDTKASTGVVTISGNSQIEGALRFISFNPKGEQMDHYWPRVKLSPNGDFSVKSGDEWQTIPFNIEILKKGNLEAVYSTSRGATA